MLIINQDATALVEHQAVRRDGKTIYINGDVIGGTYSNVDEAANVLQKIAEAWGESRDSGTDSYYYYMPDAGEPEPEEVL